MSCTVRVRTSDDYYAGTSSGIFITLYGGGSSGEHQLTGDFSRGVVATTDFTAYFISAPDRFDIRHDGTGMYSGWTMDWIEVACHDAGIDVHIGCGCDFDGNSKTFSIGVARQCSSRQSLTNGSMSCTHYNYVGSMCTYTCLADNYLRQGPECVTCQYWSSEWTAADGTTSCHELCHWRRSYCYPGHCNGTTGQQLASTCVCQPGFKLTNVNGALCDLDVAPDLSTCRVGVTDSQGTSTISTVTGNSTHCQYQPDVWINSVPALLHVALKAGLNVTLTDEQSYVPRSEVGIIGLRVTLAKKTLYGTEQTLIPESTLSGTAPFNHAVDVQHPVTGGQEFEFEGDLNISSNLTMQDGDSVCVDMKAVGGGYYNVTNYLGVYQTTVEFTSTYTTRRICFIYDLTRPTHCSELAAPIPSNCSHEPFTLSTRITHDPEVEVTVDGWVDPRPPGGENNEKSASGVDRFKLEVHEMISENGKVFMKSSAIKELTHQWTVDADSDSYPTAVSKVTVRLPRSDESRLYALVLEVHDKAGNVRYARRLVLVDNSTEANMPHTNLTVVYANPSSGSLWQTNVSLPLCVNWTGHFFGPRQQDSIFLLPGFSANTSLDENERETSFTPINETHILTGLTKIEMAWSLGNSSKSPFTQVNVVDALSQTTCLQRELQDGEVFQLFVRAYDIANNFQEDSVRVSIDHTGPEVRAQILQGAWDTDGLTVHNSTDLSTLRLVLTAQDPHSGLTSIHWTLGKRPLTRDVGEGAVDIQRRVNVTSCSLQSDQFCYCPALGPCESSRYLITFNGLVDNNTHQSNHHREYFVTITVTNTASLTTTLTLDILLDDSPPTVGVVWEGTNVDGQTEMNFTSNPKIYVHWQGFEDQESGLKMFRVAVAERCLNVTEVEAAENGTIVDYTETITSFIMPHAGHYKVTVVAYNGALQPSTAVCSDGFVYDIDPPSIFNVSIINGHIGHMMVGCTQPGHAWLVNSNLTRVALSNVTQCNHVCSRNSSLAEVEQWPLSSSKSLDTHQSEHLCRNLPVLQDNSFLVLPSDNVRVTWRACDVDSGIEEYYVGLGSDRSASAAPDLLPFTPTHGHPSYYARHAGLSNGDVFFIFLKAKNKAGLSTTLSLGPVLIDVTTQDVNQLLTAVIEDRYVKVSWNGKVFADPAQVDGVDLQFSFRVGYDPEHRGSPNTSLSQCP